MSKKVARKVQVNRNAYTVEAHILHDTCITWRFIHSLRTLRAAIWWQFLEYHNKWNGDKTMRSIFRKLRCESVRKWCCRGWSPKTEPNFGQWIEQNANGCQSAVNHSFIRSFIASATHWAFWMANVSLADRMRNAKCNPVNWLCP